jgi:polysaccharide deacetylase family protein (PEP-CTERM system associated)
MVLDVQLIKNALTIDVEDYFHVSVFEQHVSRTYWDYLPVRVEENVAKVLDLLSRHNVKATFFVLGWVAERLGKLVQQISREGHEIASHGYDHRLAYKMDPEDFRDDIRRSKAILEGVTGRHVNGYRATSYSIIRGNLGYLRILAEEGYRYDSSIFPIYHDRYGIPNWERFPKTVNHPDAEICEIPPSTFRIFGQNLPIAGGGYLRFFPVQLLAYCIGRINRSEKKPAVIYFHPWELDPCQPRIKIPRLSSFRHYNNIADTERKLDYLLKRFRFCPMCELECMAGVTL